MKLWVLERQAVGLTIFSVLVLGVVGAGLYAAISRPSCTDGRQNGTEEGPDCGGQCPSQCLGTPKDPRVLWSRFFEVSSGVYDVGALLENVNLTQGADALDYEFKLYDSDNVLLVKRTGTISFMPNKKTFVYEPHLDTKGKPPARVDFSYKINAWKLVPASDPEDITVVDKAFHYDPYPTVNATIFNNAVFEEARLEVSVLLEHADGTVYAASRTIVEHLGDHERRDISFTWPESNFGDPVNITLLYRRLPQ